MSENQPRLQRDLYDHEHDDPRSSGGRRRRPVADWGVGEDAFEHMPRRRFSRTAEGPPRDRRFGNREGERRGRGADGRRTVVIGRPEDVPSEIAALTADRDLGDLGPEAAPPVAGERRTVRIGGRPEGSPEAARYHQGPQRLRGSRSTAERLGARPERLAAWAVALGILLILIAILTAS